MTATAQGKDGVGTNPLVPADPAHRRRRSETRSRVFRELVHIAATQGATIPLGVSTGEALQQCLDRAVSLLRFAQDQVDSILPEDHDDTIPFSRLSPKDDPLYEVYENPQGPPVIRQHRYILMEREARLEVEKLAAMMTQLGIAERVVRLEEAKAALFIAAVREAAIDAGLDHEAVRKLGAALRHRVEGGLQQKQPVPKNEAYVEAVSSFKASQDIEGSIAETPDDPAPPA